MENEIEKKPCGLWWPIKDTNYNDNQYQIKNPKNISSYCKKTNVCVQAGGRCGTYPILYSKIFKNVYTFEPEPLNYYCMKKNIKESNIIAKQACLGETFKNVKVSLPAKKTAKTGINIGTYQVSGEGDIPMITIDSLNLNDCNLIHLDIEGYEGLAIQGAVRTIAKFKPIICLEENGLGKQFGFTKSSIIKMLDNMNYNYKTNIKSDMLFVYNA